MPSLQEHPKIPKYWTLTERLRRQVEQGQLRPGDRMPSRAQVQTQYGVSPGTAEKVFSELEKEGLIVREQGRGTFVAQPRVKAATGVLAVLNQSLAENADQEYWSQLLRGIRDAARKAQRQILLVDHPEDWSGFERVDGVLWDGSQPDVERRLPAGLPRVAMLVPHKDAPSVVADDYQGGRRATEHLLQLGHRRIGFLKADNAFTAQRLAGYRDALHSAGIAPQDDWLHPLEFVTQAPYELFEVVGARGMKHWLAHGWSTPGCTALLAQNDLTAIGMIGVLQAAGWNVPRDVSVVGFDNINAGRYFSPALTTVEAPLFAIGARAVELLVAQIEGREVVSQVFPVELVARASSAPPAKP